MRGNAQLWCMHGNMCLPGIPGDLEGEQYMIRRVKWKCIGKQCACKPDGELVPLSHLPRCMHCSGIRHVQKDMTGPPRGRDESQAVPSSPPLFHPPVPPLLNPAAQSSKFYSSASARSCRRDSRSSPEEILLLQRMQISFRARSKPWAVLGVPLAPN